MFVAMFLLTLTAGCSGLLGETAKPSESTAAKKTTKEVVETVVQKELFEKTLEEYGLGIDTIFIPELFWSPGDKQLIFTGTKKNPKKDGDYAVILADTEKNTMIKLKDGMLRAKPSWTTDESLTVFGTNEGLFLYKTSTADMKKISDKGYSPSVSPDNRKIAYVNDGIWVYDIERQVSTQITKGKYDASPIWFSDNTRIFYFRDNDKNLGDGAGNQQVMSILDTSNPVKLKDVFVDRKGKFRSAQWLEDDKVIRINAGWDDGHFEYIADLAKNSLIDVGELYMGMPGETISYNKKAGRVLKAANGLVELYDFGMKKTGELFINDDTSFSEAVDNLWHTPLAGNRVVYVLINKEQTRGSVMMSYAGEDSKQTRFTPYGDYTIPVACNSGEKIAFFENGKRLRIIDLNNSKGEQMVTVPGKSRAFRELQQMFPDVVGTQWIYNGFAEYGHRMKIDGINGQPGQSREYLISGKVADMSGGEGKADFSLYLEYHISGDGVKEIVKKGEKLPHKIREFYILKAPLVKGNKWTEKVKINGKETELNAEIMELSKEVQTNKKVIEVQYTAKADGMPNGVYKETRVFKEKSGVVSFENTFSKEIEFNYSLYKIGIEK